MNLPNASTTAAFVAATSLMVIPGFSRITLECDYTSPENRRNPMHYHWDVSNRISPMGKMNMPFGENPLINVVRPLGGKSRNGKKILDEDTYRWDGQKYIYDWRPLKKHIDTVQRKARVFQLMIDNPPWAFQRGIDFKGQPEVETYGNAWPPNDPKAWSLYIQAMLGELIDTYGREQVGGWRYCIGREIGTAGHWRASRMEFFEHYRNTERTIHSVLPEAKVGTHFLWASSKNSFGPEFVKWCERNKVRYDFIGVSYYPFYNKIQRVNMEHVYKVDFAPIKDIPEWNHGATLEIHEFALITSMSKTGNSFSNAPKAHQESFAVMLGKMMYEHNVVDVFRWGTGENKLAEQAFLSMKGNINYTSSKTGSPTGSGNMVDAVFALDESSQQYNIMVYNYNATPDAKTEEPVGVVTTLPVPQGTEIRYRNASYRNGGLAWGGWKTLRTVPVSGSPNSKIEFSIQLPPFSFQKVELRAPGSARSASSKVRRVLTERGTGAETEVELVDVKSGNLLCDVKGKRLVIPISALSEEDVKFLKQWVKDK